MAKKEMTLPEALAIVKYAYVDDFGQFHKVDRVEYLMRAGADEMQYGISYCVFMQLDNAPTIVLLNAANVRLSQNVKMKI